MKQSTFFLLPEHDLNLLYDALNYMKVAELKKCCHYLALEESGKKGELIERIMYFMKTGLPKESTEIPLISKARSHDPQPLCNQSLMLHGGYKNDSKTRAFFKALIGPHFHFTAFGIDWLNEQWLQGKPPTYQEFANYWSQEQKRRQQVAAAPKKEWAYINFLQQEKDSSISRKEAMLKWKALRSEKAAFAETTIKNSARKVQIFSKSV